MTDKYLPGPYDLDTPPGSERAKRITIRRLGIAVAVVYGRKKGEALATAKLLAAAPEMLEFIEITMTHFPPEHIAVKRAQEIIAKIKGQP